MSFFHIHKEYCIKFWLLRPICGHKNGKSYNSKNYFCRTFLYFMYIDVFLSLGTFSYSFSLLFSRFVCVCEFIFTSSYLCLSVAVLWTVCSCPFFVVPKRRNVLQIIVRRHFGFKNPKNSFAHTSLRIIKIKGCRYCPIFSYFRYIKTNKTYWANSTFQKYIWKGQGCT